MGESPVGSGTPPEPHQYTQSGGSLRRFFAGSRLPMWIRRAVRRNIKRSPELTLSLPWGSPITVSGIEHIGRRIFIDGLYDLATCELIWRLVEPGDACMDVGANIGQMTSLMVHRTGPTGFIYSFEAHPRVFARLQKNAEMWGGKTQLLNQAISETPGTLRIVEPEGFSGNNGIGQIIPDSDTGEGYQIPATTLDSVISGDLRVKLLKLDIEHHELPALTGAQSALGSKAIENIVYEDWQGYPSDVSNLLESFGYAICRYRAGLRRLVIQEATGTGFTSPGDGDYVATLDLPKLRRTLRQPGYECLLSG